MKNIRIREAGAATAKSRRYGRSAAIIAAMGVFMASTGLSLVVVGSANAAPATSGHKSYVCKFVDTPGVAERLKDGVQPIWVDNSSLPGYQTDSQVVVGAVFADGQSKSIVVIPNSPRLAPNDPALVAALATCGVVTPSVTYTESTCLNGAATAPSWVGTDTGKISYAVTSGSVAAGQSVTITATAKLGYYFSDGSNPPKWVTTLVLPSHVFAAAPTNCSTGPNATIVTPVITATDATCQSPSPSLTLTAVKGLTYTLTINGAPVTNLNTPIVVGDVVDVVASADSGYTLDASWTNPYTHTFKAAGPCTRADSLTVPDVEPFQATCTSPVVGYTSTNSLGIDYAVTSGSLTPGSSAVVTATAQPGYTFVAGQKVYTKTFPITFDPVPTNCGSTSTRTAIEPVFVDPTCTGTAGINLAGQGTMTSAQIAAAGGKKDVGNVTYTVTGSVAPGGTAVVTAAADSGYTMVAGAKTSWSHTFALTSPCTRAAMHAIDSGLVGPIGASGNHMRAMGIALSGAGVALMLGGFFLSRRRWDA